MYVSSSHIRNACLAYRLVCGSRQRELMYPIIREVLTGIKLKPPYSGNYEDSQVYVIDGYIVSDNLQVEQVNVVDTDFEYTDHQPVSLRVTLQRM